MPKDFEVQERATTSDESVPAVKTVTAAEGIPKGFTVMDVGPATISANKEEILRSSAAVWNGPMGEFKREGFEAGTKGMVDAFVRATGLGCHTVISGDDTIEAYLQYGTNHFYANQTQHGSPVPREIKLGNAGMVTHISTGSEASVALFAGMPMPGLSCLPYKGFGPIQRPKAANLMKGFLSKLWTNPIVGGKSGMVGMSRLFAKSAEEGTEVPFLTKEGLKQYAKDMQKDYSVNPPTWTGEPRGSVPSSAFKEREERQA